MKKNKKTCLITQLIKPISNHETKRKHRKARKFRFKWDWAHFDAEGWVLEIVFGEHQQGRPVDEVHITK